MNKIEHIGIAVKNIEESNKIFSEIFAALPYKQELIDSEKVLTSFFKMGESKIELLAATHSSSPIAMFIEKKGEGIHHIAFEVEDIRSEMKRLQALGYKLIYEEPKKGADNKLICFIHPKSANGILIELCQEMKH